MNQLPLSIDMHLLWITSTHFAFFQEKKEKERLEKKEQMEKEKQEKLQQKEEEKKKKMEQLKWGLLLFDKFSFYFCAVSRAEAAVSHFWQCNPSMWPRSMAFLWAFGEHCKLMISQWQYWQDLCYLVFYQIWSAYTGNKIRNQSDVLAVILFDQFSKHSGGGGGGGGACFLGREGSWLFANTPLVAVWTAMYLTGFHEPLLPPYRCHTSLKNV